MPLLKSLLKSRARYKAQIKAAEKRAVNEVKAAARAERRREKLLAKTERSLLKAEKQGLKAKRKHAYKMAQTELAKKRAGKINASTVNRWLAAGRVASVFLVPVAYRALTQFKEQATQKEAARFGISAEQLAAYSGYGAPLRARIAGLRAQIEAANRLSAGFKQDAAERLEQLDNSVISAENMTPQMRSDAHDSISTDLNQLAREVTQRG